MKGAIENPFVIDALQPFQALPRGRTPLRPTLALSTSEITIDRRRTETGREIVRQVAKIAATSDHHPRFRRPPTRERLFQG
jgi:hypothetical protein